MRFLPALTAASLLLGTPARATRIGVQIIERRESNTEFTVSYPGYAQSNCSISAYSNQAHVDCSQTNAPASVAAYHVQGFLLTLRLPDNRLVLVTCEKKANWSEWNTNWYRSCRHPLTDAVEADFAGDNAKLEWSVSLDGKKKQRETYKIIAVLDPVRSQP